MPLITTTDILSALNVKKELRIKQRNIRLIHVHTVVDKQSPLNLLDKEKHITKYDTLFYPYRCK